MKDLKSETINTESIPETIVQDEAELFEGMKVGDDGFPMTKRRIRMHRCFNVYLLWGIASLLVCFGFVVASFFQGQEMTFFELVAHGGAEFNGHSVAGLMRIEAVFCLISGVFCIAMSLYGFSWFYDDYTAKPIKRITKILSVICVLWIYVSLFVGLLEPLAPLTLILLFAQQRLMKGIEEEKPSLKRIVIPKEEVKA